MEKKTKNSMAKKSRKMEVQRPLKRKVEEK